MRLVLQTSHNTVLKAYWTPIQTTTMKGYYRVTIGLQRGYNGLIRVMATLEMWQFFTFKRVGTFNHLSIGLLPACPLFSHYAPLFYHLWQLLFKRFFIAANKGTFSIKVLTVCCELKLSQWGRVKFLIEVRNVFGGRVSFPGEKPMS